MKYLNILLFICCVHIGWAQQLQHNVFYGLNNQELYDRVLSSFKSNTTLDYGVARDTLYGRIDVVKDSLECIYTGMKVYIEPGTDPTQSAFNGSGGGINAEHGYPQSKGASGIAKSDMHILYPSRVIVNSTRMSNPLLDIPDNQTQKWFVGDKDQTSIPSPSVIDQYSESTATVFEPREKSKGNLARSVFYFYTMYREQADAADPDFFNIQKNTLCQWHIDDPIDSVEWKRTWAISKYQEGKPNPFVLDCSLVARMYCNNLDQACEELVRITSETHDDLMTESINIFPNPFDRFIGINSGKSMGQCNVLLTDMYGRKVWVERSLMQEGNNIIATPEWLSPGMYVLIIKDGSGEMTSRIVLKQ